MPRSATRSYRTARTALTVAVTVTVAAVLLSGSPAGASAGSRTPGTSNAARSGSVALDAGYAVTVPLCAQPADPLRVRCFALARRPVPAGTPGAYRYSISTGSADAAGPIRGPVGGYTPGDFADAYGYDPHRDRSHFTVGVVLWHNDPHARADLDRFDRHYGFPKETPRSLRIVNQKGHTSPLPATDHHAAGEISLDLQTIRSVCRSCRILLVEASQPVDTDLATAENTAVRMGARVVNNSFGEGERPVARRVRRAFDHPGKVIVASTGDDGWYGWDFANAPHGQSDSTPSFPASTPSVVSVGGTTLKLGAHGQRVGETVWNSNGPTDNTGSAHDLALGASGGGCSRRYAAQPWQRHHHGYRATHCHGTRVSADIAADGDPQTGLDVYDSYAGGWITIGGTSLSAPLISGMFALAGGAQGARYPSSALYTNASAYPQRRFDVHAGGNGYCGGATTSACANAVATRYPHAGTHNPNAVRRGLLDCSFPRRGRDATRPPLRSECNAGPGFDGPSGIGAPTSLRLLHRTDPRLRITRPAIKRVGHVGTFIARVRESVPHTHATTFIWQWGDGRRLTTHRARARHTYRRAGRHVIRLRVIDSRWQVVVARARIRVISR